MKRQGKVLWRRIASLITALLMVVSLLPGNLVSLVSEASVPSGTTIYLDLRDIEWNKDGARIYLQLSPNNSMSSDYWYEMQETSVTGVYSATVSGENNYNYLAFLRRNSGNTETWNYTAVQEIGNTVNSGKNCFKLTSFGGNGAAAAGSWTAFSTGGGGEDPNPPVGDTYTVYFDMTNMSSKWSDLYVYCFSSTSNKNTGALKKVSPISITGPTDNRYTATIEAGSNYDKIIFANSSNWTTANAGWNRTVNLDLENGKTYVAEKQPGGVAEGKAAYACNSVVVTNPNNFPSAVTGKATFYDLYTDYEIESHKGITSSDGQTWDALSRGRAFTKYVNSAISAKNLTYPMYYGNFQPGYMVGDKSNASKWYMTTDYDDLPLDGENLVYNNVIQSAYSNFYWVINRSVDVDKAGKGDYGAVTQGLVDATLTNGNITQNGQTLPQFDSAFLNTNPNSVNKLLNGNDFNNRPIQLQTLGKTYDTMDFPFREDKSAGYLKYVFDSQTDTVRVSDDEKSLTYYGNGENQVKGKMADGTESPGFFPFNDPFNSTDNILEQNINYGFGMKLEVEFTVNEDGKITGTDGTTKYPATFTFTGDDDVWVFVDGKLALDLGGDHGKATGTLDFSQNKDGQPDSNFGTATVKYVKTANGQTNVADLVNLEKSYGNKAWINVTTAPEDSKIKSNFAINKTSGETHKLTIFYSERGMFESNFKAEFALEFPTELTVTNTVDTDNVNDFFAGDIKNIVDTTNFVYSVNEKTTGDFSTVNGSYIKHDGTTSEQNPVTVNNNESATYKNVLTNGAYVQVQQNPNETQQSLFTTNWVLKEKETETLISSSYLQAESLNTTDGSDNHTSFYFTGKDDSGNPSTSYPVKMQVDYVQSVNTGNIAIQKKIPASASMTDAYNFNVYVGTAASGGEASRLYTGTYYLYDEAGNMTEKTASNGVISLKPTEYAVIKNIPVNTSYKIVETEGVSYSLINVAKESVTENNSSVSDNDTNVAVSVSGRYASGVVGQDYSYESDTFTFTNDVKALEDSFLVESGKENTLKLVPSADESGAGGSVSTITSKWNDAMDKYKDGTYTLVITDRSGNDVTGTENSDGTVTYIVDGNTYVLTPNKDGSDGPSITYVPNDNGESDVFSYRLVDDDGNTVLDKTTVTNYKFKANNDAYVLDYGLNVELSKATGNGLFENDKLVNKDLTTSVSTYWNTGKDKSEAEATASTGMSQSTNAVTGTYGKVEPSVSKTGTWTINYTGNQLSSYPDVEYSMSKFLDGEDDYNYNVMVKRNGSVSDSQTTNRYRVNLTSNVEIIPASIVYYEDNFNVDSSIQYTGNTSVNGSASAGGQSNELTGEYGNDNYYNGQYGDSAGTSRKMTTESYANIAKATFAFTGTGFDIVGTTSPTSPYLLVKAVGTDGFTKQQLVDTYYQQGTLYHVPVVHFDLPSYQEYTVTVEVLPAGSVSNSGERNTFYMDGIRIYNPLNADSSNVTQYNTDEKNVDIREVRTDVMANQIALVKPNKDAENFREAIANAGYTVIENYGSDTETGEKYTVNSSSTPDDTDESLTAYLNAGPNNETYMGAGYGFAFRVESTGDTYLQVEAKSLAGKAVTLTVKNYGNPDNDQTITVDSSVSRYYKIDLTKCEKSASGAYNVVIVVEGDEGSVPTPVISFTNMKLTKGVTLKAVNYTTGEGSTNVGVADSQNSEQGSTQKSKYAEFTIDDNGNTYMKKLNFEVSVF